MRRSPVSAAAALAAGIVASTLLSTPSLRGFSLTSESLGIAAAGFGYQRDVRVFDNSTDVASNDNQTFDPEHPGALGAPLAAWKAARAWGSHAGGAGANFDFDWQGRATSIAAADENTIGWAPCGSSPPFGFIEFPSFDGWRIVLCSEWIWSDGPDLPSAPQTDIQGVVAHELGHALGLAHSQAAFCGGSCDVQPTMCAQSCLTTAANARDLAPDDVAGVAAIYGAIPPSKPRITGISGSVQPGGTLVIEGIGFAPVVNVKFTAETSQDTGAIPGVVHGVATTGTQLSVAIPAEARSGNVLVWQPAQGLLSNAFPVDVGGSLPVAPAVASVSPAQVAAFPPATIAVTGSALTHATQVTAGGLAVPFTIVDDSKLTFASPAPAALGPQDVVVVSPFGASNAAAYSVVETSPPVLQANALAFSNAPFLWSHGGPAGHFWFLIVGGSPATFPFRGYDVLLVADLLGLGIHPATGLSGHAITVPPGLAGKTFFSQVLTFDGAFDIQASNVTSTTIFF